MANNIHAKTSSGECQRCCPNYADSYSGFQWHTTVSPSNTVLYSASFSLWQRSQRHNLLIVPIRQHRTRSVLPRSKECRRLSALLSNLPTSIASELTFARVFAACILNICMSLYVIRTLKNKILLILKSWRFYRQLLFMVMLLVGIIIAMNSA